ncbi:hypothetical protein DFH06DRAFT_1289469 [Mycena polygramma]|nr:hypothetical protein DFH06DRAFT_1289469 [Mycena polygramma]
MDKDKLETQTRSSFGRVVSTFTGNPNRDWFKVNVPSSKQAYVELHIRRAKGNVGHECGIDPKYPGYHVDEIDIDLIDDPNELKEPFIIFRFNILPVPKQEPNAASVAKSTGAPAVLPLQMWTHIRVEFVAVSKQDVAEASASKSRVPQKRKQGQLPASGSSSSPVFNLTDLMGPRPSRQESASPVSQGPSRASDDRNLLELLEAAKKEEETVDTELELLLQATEKRIAKKKKVLGKVYVEGKHIDFLELPPSKGGGLPPKLSIVGRVPGNADR